MIRIIQLSLPLLLLSAGILSAEGDSAVYYGEAFEVPTTPIPSVGTVMGDTTRHGADVILTGTILDVCQKKGCWIVVSDGTSQMRVTFRDYSFFLPTDSFNRTVVIRGVVTVETIDEETAKHYAEESKGEDPEAIDGPQQVVTMVADGVLVQR